MKNKTELLGGKKKEKSLQLSMILKLVYAQRSELK